MFVLMCGVPSYALFAVETKVGYLQETSSVWAASNGAFLNSRQFRYIYSSYAALNPVFWKIT